MRKIAFFIVITGLLATACLFGPSNNINNSKMILAHVGDKPVSATEMDSLALMEGFAITDTTDTESLKQDLLDSLIDSKLVEMLQDSLAKTLDKDLDFVESRNREVANAVFRLMYQEEVRAQINVDSSDVQKHYDDNIDMYVTPEQVKASHILIPPPPPDTAGVKSEDKKAKIIEKNDKETRARALAVYEKAIAGEEWDSLVVLYSQDATNNQKGGDLGYFGRGRMVAPFDSAAFSAEVGDIVGPVKTRYGYHIISIDDYKEAQPIELDTELFTEIESLIRSQQEKERADIFLDSLRAEATFEFNEDALAKEDSLVDPATWVMVVNTTDTIYQQRMSKDFPKYLRFKGITEWTVEDKKNMLKEISANSLLRAAGKELGYYQDPGALEAKDKFTMREARIKATNFLRDLEYKPSEEEMESYYNEHFAELYEEKKPFHVQHIIFEDSSKAMAIRDSLVNGADFKEMALKYYPGELEIREVAYDLGYISDEELGKDFFNRIKGLEKGEISMPFKTEWGYHIVKLVNKREDKTLDQVRPGIRKKLMEAADKKVKEEYLEAKRQKVDITINHDAVKKYKFPETLYSVEIKT